MELKGNKYLLGFWTSVVVLWTVGLLLHSSSLLQLNLLFSIVAVMASMFQLSFLVGVKSKKVIGLKAFNLYENQVSSAIIITAIALGSIGIAWVMVSSNPLAVLLRG